MRGIGGRRRMRGAFVTRRYTRRDELRQREQSVQTGKGKALRKQRGDFIRVHGDERTGTHDVMTPH